MKNKKILAIALSVSMCLAPCQISVFAAEAASGTDLTAETDDQSVTAEIKADAAGNSDDLQGNSDIGQLEDEQTVQSDSEVDTKNEIGETVNVDEQEESADAEATSDDIQTEDDAAMLSDETSGTCGDNLTWTISDGVLTITGTGEMTDYDSFSPWDFSDIKSIVIEEGVTSIGNFAFRCTGCEEVEIPSTVISIGEYAFDDCDYLTSLKIPDNVSEIGKNAFSDCSALTEIVLPKNLTELSDYLFMCCSSLKDICIPENVMVIGENAFSWCSSLDAIDIPENVTSIGGYAFSWCSSLTTIDIPASVSELGGGVFYGCDGLTSVTIPDTVNSIGGYAFENCGNLKELILPSGLEEIDEGLCYGCTALEKITVPETVTVIGTSAFYKCSSLQEINLPAGLKTIGSRAFYQDISFKSVTLPEQLESVGDYAFYCCKNLYLVRILNKDTAFGKNAFERCNGPVFSCEEDSTAASYAEEYGYETVEPNADVPEPEQSIETDSSGKCGKNVFWSLSEDGVLTISGTGEMTDYESFNLTPWYDRYSEIKKVVVEEGVTSIGNSSFMQFVLGNGVAINPTNLSEVILPESLERIGSYAFEECDKLESINFPENLKIIDKSAFAGCSSLQEVDCPDSVTMIGSYAFGYCNFTKFVFPKDLAEIPDRVLCGCTNLTEIVLPDHPESVGDSAFDYCSGLTECILPDSVAAIGDSAFSSCSSLTEIIVPDSVTTIGDCAFSYCSCLKDVVLSKNLKTIGSGVFRHCESLLSIRFLSESTEIQDLFIKYSWDTRNENVTIICNSGSTAEAYAIENSIKYVIFGKPVISQQPENCTAGVKHQAVFSLSAENAVSYQWQYSKNGTKWYNSSASGAKTDTLTVNVSTSNYKNMYRCRLTGESGIVVYSDTVTVDLIPGAKITAQPVSVCVRSGEKAAFTVAADNATSYQWYYSKDGGTNWFKSTASGADTETLNVTVSSSNKNNLYKCKITGTDENVISSSKVGLVVIAAQPENSTAAIGTTGTFTVKADSDNPIDTYKWYYSKDSGATWYASSSAGCDTDTLSVKATTANRTNLYRCKLTSSAGLTGWTTAAGFTDVSNNVKITEQPVSVSAAVGDKVCFTVTAENVAETGGYQWYYSKDGKTWYKSGASGNASATLTITVTNTNKSNQYKCKVTGTDGTSVTSDIVSVQ